MSLTLTSHCLCKSHIFTAQISPSDLPLSAVTCHCNSCRHVTGALYSTALPWPSQTQPDLSTLKRYDFSPLLKLFFCETCSTPMFWTKKGRERVSVFTGTLVNIAVSGEEILVRFESCIYVGDTLDGGASLWLQKCNADGSEVKRYLEGPDSGEITGSFVSEEKQAMPSVPIQCHCKGVDFVLRKGDYETKSKEELPWFVDPTTRKYIASFDACDTCRLSSGVDLFNWTFAELENITLSSDLKVSTTKELRKLVDDKNPAVGTLAYYASSPDVQRYFCSKCSACVFYAADDRPDIVDVAIGLLVADGARAEGFLSWNRDKVGWSQDVKGGWREGIVRRVEQVLEERKIARREQGGDN